MTSPGLFVPGGLIIQPEGCRSTSPPSSDPHTPPRLLCPSACCRVLSNFPTIWGNRTENKELASTCAPRGLCCSLCYNQMSATSQIYSERKSEFHAQIRPEIELHLLCQENLDPVSCSFSGNRSAWSPEQNQGIKKSSLLTPHLGFREIVLRVTLAQPYFFLIKKTPKNNLTFR